MSTPNDKKLIPEAFALALTNVVSIAATLRISLGDRALDAAVCALATTLFSIFMAWIQSKTWTDVRAMIRVPMFGKGHVADAKCSGTNFDWKAASNNVPTNLKCSVLLSASVLRFMFEPWIKEKFGLEICDRISYAQKAEDLILVDPLLFIKRKPVWKCPRTGAIVYATIKEVFLELECDEDAPIADVLREIAPYGLKERGLGFQFVTHVDGTSKKLISSGISFNHLFFEQKDELLALLTRFSEKRMYAPHLEKDNKLGILLHGPPGTGKSAVVCAIAKFLRRDVKMVSGTHVRDRKVMATAFENTTDVICFDEFDLLLDVIQKRHPDATPSDVASGAAMTPQQSMAVEFLKMAVAEKDAEKKRELMEQFQEAKAPPPAVDMAFLLSKLQGIESADGRVIIATTNFPDEIDDALKRPGRFDMILYMSNCTPRMLMDMVCHYFQVSSDERADLEREFPSLPTLVFSPALVQDVAAASKSARDTLNTLLAMPTATHRAREEEFSALDMGRRQVARENGRVAFDCWRADARRVDLDADTRRVGLDANAHRVGLDANAHRFSLPFDMSALSSDFWMGDRHCDDDFVNAGTLSGKVHADDFAALLPSDFGPARHHSNV